MTFLRQAWLVILLGIAFGGALAAVQATLAPRIAQNIRDEIYAQIPALVPGAVSAQTEELEVPDPNGGIATLYRARDAAGTSVGWVFPARAQGFADLIFVLVGLDAGRQTITGIYVVDQKETPGLGNYIVDPPFRGQFAGLDANRPVTVVKQAPNAASNEVLAVTGATISSVSVADAVNESLAAYRPLLSSRY